MATVTMATDGQGDIPLEDMHPEEPPLDYDTNDVHLELEGPTIRSDRSKSRSRSGVSVDRTSSTKQLLERLPSRRLHMADTAANVMRAQSFKRKATKKSKGPHHGNHGFATLRLRDPEQLLQNEDFVDAPSEIQAENIRNVKTALRRKKEFLDKLHKEKRKSKQIGCCKASRWKMSLAWRHFKQSTAETRYSLELWSSHMKKIEGHFGSGVASYFTFLRGLVYVNLLVFTVTLAFVTIPQVVYRYLQQEPPGYGGFNSSSFTGRELLTGGGWFANTELYYGYYVNGVIEAIDVPGLRYDMRYAYILASGGFYILTVLILAVSVSRSYRKHYIEESGAAQTVATCKVFCGWDYKITEQKSAVLKHRSLYKDYQEYVAELSRNVVQRTCGQMTGLVLARIFINIFILGLVGGAGYLVWYITNSQSLSNDLDVLRDLAMPLVFTAINFILPFAFSILGIFERYKNPKTELFLTMVRTIILNIVTLGVLLYYWYHSLECHARDDISITSEQSMACRKCWENFMGEQIYQLVIMDFIFLLIITFFSEFIRRLMSQFCCKSLGHPVFNVGRNTLNLMYSQILVWLGVFYSPLLTLIHLLKLFIIFYIKRVSVLNNCVPSARPWKAGQTSTFILALLFGAFIGSFIAVAYGIAFIRPSSECGPYQGMNSSYAIITDMLDNWEESSSGHIVKGFVDIITSVGFLAFVLIGMAVAAYYCKKVAQAHNEMVKRLRNQITLEGRDKRFLLQLFQQAIGQGESMESTQTRGSLDTTRYYSGAVYPRGASGGLRRRGPSTTSQPHLTPPQEHIAIETADIHQPGYDSLQSNNPYYQDNSPNARNNDPTTGVSPRDSPSLRASPAHLRDSQLIEAQNPMYRDNSPNRKPDLPYDVTPGYGQIMDQ